MRNFDPKESALREISPLGVRRWTLSVRRFLRFLIQRTLGLPHNTRFSLGREVTATDGHRYDKVEAISIDPKALARDCQLGDVKVRFFGDSIAIAYGSESRIRKGADGKEARRCQVWTDTWLKRNGQWQIVAAQDTVIPCP